jgi:hypothetical protein
LILFESGVAASMPIPNSETLAPMPIFAARSPLGGGGGGAGAMLSVTELDSFRAGASATIAATVASSDAVDVREEAVGVVLATTVVVVALTVFPLSWAARTVEQRPATMGSATNMAIATNL